MIDVLSNHLLNLESERNEFRDLQILIAFIWKSKWILNLILFKIIVNHILRIFLSDSLLFNDEM